MAKSPAQERTIHEAPLDYAARLERRDPAILDLIVIHCTELPDLTTAREFGERIHYPESGTGNAGHFYIDRDGSVHCWVPVSRVAHHTRGYNERSVGIELVNRGRWPNWYDSRCQNMKEPYTEEQVAALCWLLEQLKALAPGLRWVAGHDQLDRTLVAASDDRGKKVSRKLDPGPMFPWPDILASTTLEPFAG